MEDDDEEDYYSSEENSLSSPRVSWSSPPLSSGVPLNPECQEFHLPPPAPAPISIVKSTTTLSEASVSSPEFYPTSYAMSSIPVDTTATSAVVMVKSELRYDESTVEFVPKASIALNNNTNHTDNEAKRLTNDADTVTPAINGNNNNHDEEDQPEPTAAVLTNKTLTNGDLTNCNKKNNHLDGNGCLLNGVEDQEDEKENERKVSDSLVTRQEAPCITKYNGHKVHNPDLGSIKLQSTTENSSTKTCSSKDDSRSIENVTAMLSATSIIEAEVSQKGADSGQYTETHLLMHSKHFFVYL